MNKKLVLTTFLLVFVVMFATELITPAQAEEEAVSAFIGTDKYTHFLCETVTLSGWAFNPQTQITLTVSRPDNRSDTWSNVTADANGEFVTYYSLDGVPGIYKVTATDGTITVENTFAASACVIWTDKMDYEPNETVTIIGSGFDPNTRINVTVSRPDNSTDVWSPSSDSYGNFTTTYTLDGVAGEYWVTATDGANEARTWFIDQFITLSPTSGPAGTLVALRGYGFSGSCVWNKIYFDGQLVAEFYSPGTNFVKDFEVPSLSPDVYLVEVISRRWHHALWCFRYYTNYHASADFQIVGPPQYDLTLDADPPDITTPIGQGSYDEGTSASISTDEYVAVDSDTRYRFNGWTTTDMTEIADPPSSTTTVLMDKDKTVTANYVLQHLVTFDQTGLDASAVETVVTVDSSEKTNADFPFSMWVDIDSSVSYTYEAIVSSSVSNKRFRLNSVTGPTSPIIVAGPTTVTGNYVTQYYLTVQTDPIGIISIPGEDWHDFGTAVNLEAPTEVAGSTGVRYIFDHWTVDEDVVSGNPITVNMNSAHTAIAVYVTQYYLTVISTYDLPGGEGWYNADETTYATLMTGLEYVDGLAYGFASWGGDASGWDLLSDPIIMDAPKTAIANWEASEAYGDVRSVGFWKHQVNVWYFTELKNNGLKIRGIGTSQISQEELIDYLVYIDSNSDYFGGKIVVYDGGGTVDKLATFENAYNILKTPRGPDSMKMRAEQQLLALWLNLAYKAFFWNTELSQDIPYIYWQYTYDDVNGLATIGEAILFCEAELTKIDGNYEAAKDVCDSINNNLGIVWGT